MLGNVCVPTLNRNDEYRMTTLGSLLVWNSPAGEKQWKKICRKKRCFIIIHFMVFSPYFKDCFLVETFLFIPWLQKLVYFMHLCSMPTSWKNQGFYLVNQTPTCTHEELYPHGTDRYGHTHTHKKKDSERGRNVLKWRGNKQALGKPEPSSM